MSFVASEIGNHRIEFGIINAFDNLKALTVTGHWQPVCGRCLKNENEKRLIY